MKKFIRLFASEPHPMDCPRCGVKMIWYPHQGPGTGGWKCPKCGLQIDKK